jgi:uncharacterized membrane protein (DUF485 family)
MNKKILFLTLSALFFPFSALAVVACDPNVISIACMVNSAVDTTLYIAAGIVVILWVITGLLFLVAQGAPEKLKSARTALFTSVAGTVLVIVAFYAIDIVGNAFGI